MNATMAIMMKIITSHFAMFMENPAIPVHPVYRRPVPV
jgi:hypothetical protein